MPVGIPEKVGATPPPWVLYVPIASAADVLVIVTVAAGMTVLLYLKYSVTTVWSTASIVAFVYHQFKAASGA
ncbi:hypothetical protein KCU61_g606, partial [Aureobasidium melanogenum]